ncbi:lipid A 3-O-deacylase PagL [Algoriphagus aquaeductus]|uniref:Lipid A 3-O-deacylase PagL n=1 Tax=Algoriphagus aquaeductus TaxID=475299 RepID=A0A326RTM2_9BACT|nr:MULTISPECIES: acyloxyacyl hydrolase [Algoriphagus]PZV83078.1 lipid A 3-O-deacylase PagL [Algoriphagus aquaeductus]
MNKINICLFLLGIFLFSLPAKSQIKYQRKLSIGYESGPLMSNGTDWGNEIRDALDYKAIDLQLGWKKISNSTYNYIYRYPTYGIGLTSTLTYSPEIGRPQAVYGFMEIPFSHGGLNKRLYFGYFTQMGVGFNFKPFDELSNPMNQYIGSNVNCYVFLGLNSTLKITDKMDLQTSFGLKHFSNGATKRPNSGINLFPLNIALNYKFGDHALIPSEPIDIPKKGLDTYWNFALYTGLKNYEVGDPAYFRGGLGVNYLLEPSYKYRLGLGLDFFWAQGINLRNPGESFNFMDQTSLALVGSWEWQLTERIYVPIGLGAYLYRNELNQEITWFYERIGVRYRFSNHLFTGMQIKAHKAKADFFEFTVGYTLQGN